MEVIQSRRAGSPRATLSAMTTTATTLATLKHVGGHPALDFINTRHHWVGTGPDREYLRDYAGLLRWSRDAGVLSAREVQALSLRAAAQSGATGRAYRDALSLRDAIHETFQALLAGRRADAGRLSVFDVWYRRALHSRRLAATSHRGLCADWDFDANALPLELPLLKLAFLAVEFATTVESGRLKECPAEPGCGWMFHDTSKNRSRRWCDMSDCGNVAKSRRHYARVRKARTAER